MGRNSSGGHAALAAVALLAAACTAAPSPPPSATPPARTTALETAPAASVTPTARPPAVSPAPTAPPAAGVERFITLNAVEAHGRYVAAVPLFEYDNAVPLDVEVQSTTTAHDIVTRTITYASSTGETVPAALVAPTSHAGMPGLIWLCPCGPVVDRAQEFAPLGAIVITINPPQARRDAFLTFTAQDRDDIVELIVELRRAVDVLLAEGADPNRIAFVGYSWGAAMGGLFAGIESRLHAAAFMFGDGGLVEHTLETPEGLGATPVTAAALDAWLTAIEPLESLYFIPHASAALLFQNGMHDESVAEVSARRFQEAASQPKDVRWYDSGHDPTPDAPQVWCDLAKWLEVELELSTADIAECG